MPRNSRGAKPSSPKHEAPPRPLTGGRLSVGDRVSTAPTPFRSVAEVQAGLESASYICSTQIATAVYLALELDKPILVEGPRGLEKRSWQKPPPRF